MDTFSFREGSARTGKLSFSRCEQVGACKVRLHSSVETTEVVKILGSHSDEPNPARIEVPCKLLNLEERAMRSQENPLQLIENDFRLNKSSRQSWNHVDSHQPCQEKGVESSSDASAEESDSNSR